VPSDISHVTANLIIDRFPFKFAAVRSRRVSSNRCAPSCLKLKRTQRPSAIQTHPPSMVGSAEDQEQTTKKPRNRKASKKPIPHSSTLQALWGHPKPSEEATSSISGDSRTDDSRECENVQGKPGEPIVLKLPSSNLAAAGSPPLVARPPTPPNSMPDVIPETPKQSNPETNVSPKSRRGAKKRQLPNSPTEGVRRSPRNHSTANDSAGALKTHPFFLGKAARMCGRWLSNGRASATGLHYARAIECTGSRTRRTASETAEICHPPVRTTCPADAPKAESVPCR